MSEIKAIEKPRDIWDLITACNKPNAKKVDIAELRQRIAEEANEIGPAGDLALQNLKLITTESGFTPAAQILTDADIKNKRADLGYKQAPRLEKMLIDALLLAWLRYQKIENNYHSMNQGEGMSLQKAMFWEKRLSMAQARYLKAAETLARVRKLTSPILQVNVAQEGSQQVNVAGDLVKG